MNLFHSNKLRTEPRSKARNERNKINKFTFIKIGIIAVLLIFCVSFQIKIPKFFGATPALVLSFSCAIGFLFDKKFGAVTGIAGGFLLDCLGSFGFSFSVPFFMLCGYLCGALKGNFLSDNFLSFLIYGIFVGLVREVFIFLYCMVFSSAFSPIKTTINILLPDFAAFVIILPFSYLILFAFKRILDKINIKLIKK